MLLTEFDETLTSTFNPDEVVSKIEGFPKIGVACFSTKILNNYIGIHNPEVIAHVDTTNGKINIYKINYKGVDIALFMALLGAPAVVATYEEVLVMGLEKLIVFGSCGVLDKTIDEYSIIIPTSAIRDEGTSYHYLKASDEIKVNDKYIDEFQEILDAHNYSHVKGKTWTIDAPYRETRNKMVKRKEQGCVCVDMECASLFAVAKFRNTELFQFFYAVDNLDGIKWDKRSLGSDEKLDKKSKTIILALELAVKMSK